MKTRLRAPQERSGIDASDTGCRLAIISTTTLGGLLIVLALFDFLGQAFFFAQLLETSEHLFDAFAATGLDSNRHLGEVLTETSQRIGHETHASREATHYTGFPVRTQPTNKDPHCKKRGGNVN